jgi:hypothetical protein
MGTLAYVFNCHFTKDYPELGVNDDYVQVEIASEDSYQGVKTHLNSYKLGTIEEVGHRLWMLLSYFSKEEIL